MRIIHVKDILYKLTDNTIRYTLPTAISLNVDEDFNKYTDIAKRIKEYIGHEPSFYTFEEGSMST